MVRVAMIGTGGVAVQNHIPGLRTHPQGEVVALCDPNPQALAKASEASGVTRTYGDWNEVIAQDDIDAVVIATPNNLHMPIAVAAAQAGKHVMSEKPLGLNYEESEAMVAAVTAAGVVNMTAFTYRFVPAIRYMKHLMDSGIVGVPYHFRVNRLQDWTDRAVGWRQVKALAGSGELGDMLSHRIDYGHYLIGPIGRVVAEMRQYLTERRNPDGTTQASDVDDWVAFLGDFVGGTTGVFESTKMAAGRGFYLYSQDYVEINGSDASLIYFLNAPHQLLVGKSGGDMETVQLPEEFLKVPGSPRDPHAGDPLQVFRYDQSFEFIQAIVEGRPASPDFHDGSRAQAVVDAVILSATNRQWVHVPGAEVA
ncbi:MAG: Gfo/Idh/MocA family oxidoreductase [Thermomicrobia bacterium]|nr:Gfo/Idh/MocA family oxidoreductase [Thermomicrobia bacterium]